MENIHAYSDSTIVLAWLDGTPQRYKLYVANRISKTIQLIPPTAWKYVPTSENPADCASRGLTAKELIHHQLWWHGPQWLLQHPVKIPAQPTASQLKKAEQEDDQKHDAPTQQCNVVAVQTDDQLESRSKSFSTLIKITCWVRRFMARAKKKEIPQTKKLSVAEAIAAEDFLRRRSQARAFPAELHQLKAEPPKPLSAKSKLLALHPTLNKKGLLCVGGRLRNSLLEEEQKHPVILSCSPGYFSNTIIRNCCMEDLPYCYHTQENFIMSLEPGGWLEQSALNAYPAEKQLPKQAHS